MPLHRLTEEPSPVLFFADLADWRDAQAGQSDAKLPGVRRGRLRLRDLDFQYLRSLGAGEA